MTCIPPAPVNGLGLCALMVVLLFFLFSFFLWLLRHFLRPFCYHKATEKSKNWLLTKFLLCLEFFFLCFSSLQLLYNVYCFFQDAHIGWRSPSFQENGRESGDGNWNALEPPRVFQGLFLSFSLVKFLGHMLQNADLQSL